VNGLHIFVKAVALDVNYAGPARSGTRISRRGFMPPGAPYRNPLENGILETGANAPIMNRRFGHTVNTRSRYGELPNAPKDFDPGAGILTGEERCQNTAEAL
jgi:hypothetical protein